MNFEADEETIADNSIDTRKQVYDVTCKLLGIIGCCKNNLT